MLYFVLWVLFLLTVTLAVPITAFAEKRKYRALHAVPAADPQDMSEPSADPDVEFSEDQPDQEVAQFDEIGESDDADADDFPAFDELD